MIDSKTALTVALIGALAYSALVTLFAYVAIVEQTQESEGEGRITVSIQISSQRSSMELEMFEIVVVDKGTSAYGALTSIANLTTKDFAIGKYITGINDIEEGDGWHWFFYIWNFDLDEWELAPTGATSYNVSDGDFLRFALEQRGI
ncbi:MAG: hypothetical protein ACXAB4_08935 [Candidatus Hodarchaeales archaeon]|jgi:hypothetical protein